MDQPFDEEEFLLRTAYENSLSFQRVFFNHRRIKDFLTEHDYIPIRSTSASNAELDDEIEMYADIDGITIEWENIAGTTHIFHHLFLIPWGTKSLRRVYPWLKKHEDLRKYNLCNRQVLKNCMGTSIFTDCGWDYIICLLPKVNNSVSFDAPTISQITLRYLIELKIQLRKKLIEEIPGGRISQTLAKNNLNDLSQIFILPSDWVTVLGIFQECVNSVIPPPGFRKCLFSFRFGEKNRDTVPLPIRDSTAVSKICVHVGVSMECEFVDSLFWSRNGLESLTGSRGTMTTACGLHECANYQSNLDGLPLSVSGILRESCVYPESIQFLQLYADVPHVYPKTRYHPVSGAIILTRGLRSASEALLSEAREYISLLRSTFMQLRTSVCRLEFVTSLPLFTNKVTGKDLVRYDRVRQMVSDHALLVPFLTDQLNASIREIGLNMCETLELNLNNFQGTSCSESVWEVYQYELALEKLLWGHPLTFLSRQHSINLGPGIECPSRSASDEFGFLRLENKFSCCIDESSTPPLNIYSRSQCVQNQVRKTFGFWDHINGSASVLGRRLLEVLLQDLFDVGVVHTSFGAYLTMLKEGGQYVRSVGVISKSDLAKKLMNVKKCKFPMVYIQLLNMLKKSGKDLESTISKGLEELQLIHFPAFRDVDEHRHRYMYWKFSYGVWTIRDLLPTDSDKTKASIICALVINELETRKLCFTRSLEGTIKSFPWIPPCLRKLDELKLGEEELVLVMTFVTCVAFLEAGRFVDYYKLRALRDALPVPQYRLRNFEIQGKMLVNNMNAFKVWRLHPRIPRKLQDKMNYQKEQSKDDTSKIYKELETDFAEKDAIPVINEEEYAGNLNETKFAHSTVRHRPTNQNIRWTSQELEIVHDLSKKYGQNSSSLTLYTAYQKECRSCGIPDRSMDSFRSKYSRVSKDEGRI